MEMNLETRLAKQLADFRNQLGLSQEAVCQRLAQRGIHWTQQTLWKVEHNRRSLKAVELFALADALGAPAEAFATGNSRRLCVLAELTHAREQLEAAQRECDRLEGELKNLNRKTALPGKTGTILDGTVDLRHMR